MQTLTIKAGTLESARGFMSGLADFRADLSEAEDGSYRVQIMLSSGEREITALLSALETYVTYRNRGPAEVGLAGRTYELHPTNPPPQGVPAGL